METLNKDKTDHLREFGLTTFAIDNRTSIFILTLMIMLLGISSYKSVPKEAFPEITIATIFISTPYPGNSPKDIENLVTRPLEKEIGTISELDELSSRSIQDFSIITAKFGTNLDAAEALQKVKDVVDKAKTELPKDLPADPGISELNLGEFPIMSINLSGEYSNDQLKNYAEHLQEQIEELPEIASVNLKGALDKEVKIDVDLKKMMAVQVNFLDIEKAVRSENLNMSGGEILNNGFRQSIRVLGEFVSVKGLEDLIIKNERNSPIFLRDFATVSFGNKEKTSIARSNQLPVISLDVIKTGGENLITSAEKIKTIIAKAQQDIFPKELTISIFNDKSNQTNDNLNGLLNSIALGIILVMLILMFFMGTRNSIFVGLAIPLSILMGIIIINLIGYTLNIVVLFSMVLALGMLVDNAIVVVENIYRYKHEGYNNLDAAKYGTSEVAKPIIASTATTLAAFIPLAYWPGILGAFMKYLPVTLIVVLTSSLFIALVITPVLTAAYMRLEKSQTAEEKKRKLKNTVIMILAMLALIAFGHATQRLPLRNTMIFATVIILLDSFVFKYITRGFQKYILPKMETAYHWFISKTLNGFAPTFLFIGTFALLVFSIFLLKNSDSKIELFASADPNYINAFVEMPLGRDIEETSDFMKKVETKVTEEMEPFAPIIESILVQIGENTNDPKSGVSFGSTPNKARLTVAFIQAKDRGSLSSKDAIKVLQDAVKDFSGGKIVVAPEQSGPASKMPIDIQLTGEHIDSLNVMAENLIGFIKKKNIQGIEDLKANVEFRKPEMQIRINRKAARTHQISTAQIATAIRTSVFGKEISTFKQGEDEYPITLRLAEAYRNDKESLLNQSLSFKNPSNGRMAQVPISSVAEVNFQASYNQISREDQERVIAITSNVKEGFNGNDVVKEIKTALLDFKTSKGYSYGFAGEQKDMAEQSAFLKAAFLVALFAIFLILVTQFNSVYSPVIVLLSILFSTIGVFFGYVYTEMTIVIVMTGVGIISLAGIVVNNAIVLVDYINLVIQRKQEEQNLTTIQQLSKADVKAAIIEGGGTRLRPVLLTAVTTVLGLLPLAMGINIDFFSLITELDPHFYIGGESVKFWGTIAWTVIFGLVFSTFLTLVVVPVMYWLAYRMKMVFGKTFNSNKTNTLEAASM